ncbi:MAG: hypothetical protein KKC77_19210 [Proteobacteria bacterium]|nr:hypothetical protein [Pseudomonadota bacterium]
MEEIVELRDWRAKTFNLGGDKRQLVLSNALQNWHDGTEWHEIDTSLIDMGDYYSTTSTPYDVKIYKDKPRLEYTSKLGKGSVNIKIKDNTSGGASLDNPNRKVKFVDCMTDLDIEVLCMPGGVEIFKILKTPTAPHSIDWEFAEDVGMTLKVKNINPEVRGWEKKAHGRDTELIHGKSTEVVNAGKKTYTITEDFTGRVKTIDPVTHIATWTEDAEYPIKIDVLVNEAIANELDDGSYMTAYSWWQGGLCRLWDNFTPAWRFQSVAIPVGATIDDPSTFKCKTGAETANRDGTFYGNDVDDAAYWAYQSVNNPLTMEKTAASTVQSGFPNYADVTIDVKDIIQEIVDRGGWAENNDIRIGVGAKAGSGNTSFYDYPDANAGRLSINYTAGAAGGAVRKPRATISISSLLPMYLAVGVLKNKVMTVREFLKGKWI